MMDDTELRRFITNLCNYTQGKAIELPSRIEQMIWNDVVEVLDHNEAKRVTTAEKRKEAGKKGGAPVGNNNAEKKTKVDVETSKNNQLVEEQANQTKQPEKSKELSDNSNELNDKSNVLSDVSNKLLGIMKQVIEDGYINKEDVLGWKLKDTRGLLNDMFDDYRNWEQDLLQLGLDGFIKNANGKTRTPMDYVVYSTLKAHLIL